MMVRAPLSVSVSRMALRLGSGLQPEHAGATHAVQRLDDHVLVLVVEGFQTGHVAGHQRGRGELADFGDGQLFRVIADGRAGVEDLGALLLGVFQQMGGIHVFHVEGRILAHDDRAQIGQAHIRASASRHQSWPCRSAPSTSSMGVATARTAPSSIYRSPCMATLSVCPRATSARIMATELSLYAFKSGKGSKTNKTCIATPERTPPSLAGRRLDATS